MGQAPSVIFLAHAQALREDWLAEGVGEDVVEEEIEAGHDARAVTACAALTGIMASTAICHLSDYRRRRVGWFRSFLRSPMPHWRLALRTRIRRSG